MEHAYGRRYDSTWHVDGRMTTPLLRCALLATLHKRCHGVRDESLRRGARRLAGSPFSLLEQVSRKQAWHLGEQGSTSC